MPVTINGTSGITTPGIDASGTNKFATTIGVGGATPAASGAGITFPATQSASSDANTLDDYEEGTFTPSFTVTGGTFSSNEQSAQYTKIGNRVYFNIYVNVNISVAGTGGITFTGLPFTASTWNVTTFWSSNVAWGGVTISPLVWSGSTYVLLTTCASGSSYSSLTATTVGTGNSKEFRVTGSYQTS